MQRSELTVGGRYKGPGDECYEIVDLTPGWKLDSRGDWLADTTTRTRYIRGVTSNYRTNLMLKALIHRDGISVRAVVDPRKLTGDWMDHVVATAATDRTWQATRLLVKSAVALLSEHPAYVPRAVSDYGISKDGRLVDVPAADLQVLVEMAASYPRKPALGGVPPVNWLSP